MTRTSGKNRNETRLGLAGWKPAGSGLKRKEGNIMTGEKFAEIVTKRANERVQVKLKNFKNAIRRAFAELTGSDHLLKAGPSKETAANNLILLNMYEGFTLTPNKDWPTILWKREEEKVKDELLSMMDEMQKALLSPGPQVGDCTPAVDADEGKAEE